MKQLKIATIFFLITFSILALPVYVYAYMTSGNYIIWADVFSSGGTEDSNSAGYRISDTIGEGIILSDTSTAASYGIKAGFREMTPDKYLTFSVSALSVNLGNLEPSNPQTASHTIFIDTNADNGYSITYTAFPTTLGLAGGGADIDAIGGVAQSSANGTEQFGFNLVANTSPVVGADPVGSAPIGTIDAAYATADNFAFLSGNQLASASAFTNPTTFTVSYLANIASSTMPGSYSTVITFAAVANY